MALLEEIGAIEESMTNQKTENKITYEQFCAEWLDGIEDGNPSSLEKGVRFANKLVSQWLDVTTDDDDFVICDGSGDGYEGERLLEEDTIEFIGKSVGLKTYSAILRNSVTIPDMKVVQINRIIPDS